MENINNQSHIMYYFLGLKGLSSRIIVKDISIDHFVPWSYVAHDEMWNLNPTTKSINSFKSNKLPDWNTYFKRLAMLEYQSYRMMREYDVVHKEFEKCAKKHFNDDRLRYRIYESDIEYERFEKELEAVILPVYKSAQNCGFVEWRYI